MNYLSHLFFSTRTPLSMTGNLMGDFKPPSELIDSLPNEILLGIQNHRFVDKETDRFVGVKKLRTLFSASRRRFSGVITDLAFDYYLLKHWDHFAQVELDEFIELSYQNLGQSKDYMPDRMQSVVTSLIEQDWIRTYSSLDGLSYAINRVSERIRFKNSMHGAITEVENNYQQIESVFFELFEHLINEVKKANIENQNNLNQ